MENEIKYYPYSCIGELANAETGKNYTNAFLYDDIRSQR